MLRSLRRHLTPPVALVALTAVVLVPAAVGAAPADEPPDVLVGRAVAPARTITDGPPSGLHLGEGPINGQEVPFEGQPFQGVSAVIPVLEDGRSTGRYWAMSDNGFGAIQNSADYHLRVYEVRPDWRYAWEGTSGGRGAVEVLGWFELSDPDGHVAWPITNELSPERVLTGADFDIESVRQAPDGTFWFGDEFGPFLLHTDESGRLLEPPVPLPDLTSEGAEPGDELRSPQNPAYEEATGLRVMNAVAAHARASGAVHTPVLSPWHVLLADGDEATEVENRASPPAGSGLEAASSELFDVALFQEAGYDVVTWTVNDPDRMAQLLELGVDGIISDRPDLLHQAVAAFDADGDGTAGDLLLPDGRIDPGQFDAQGHRGGRDLRPENTLPAMEVALDNLMTTLELDTGVTADGVALLKHDPAIEAQKCRRADGAPYGPEDEVLIRDLTVEEIQSTFVCDNLFRGPDQQNDPGLSPVSEAFADEAGLADLYVPPTLAQVFDFVDAYVAHYTNGPGAGEEGAAARAANAERVRFDIETKLNPRPELADRTVGPQAFVDAVAGEVTDRGLEARADIQSFDFRTLLLVQEQHPQIRTSYLFGDFPVYDDPAIEGSDDGTNLQGIGEEGTPWLAGLAWPYRSSYDQAQPKVARSSGFEGMALSPDGTKLYPLLEAPIAGAPEGQLLIHEFDLERGEYTGKWWTYQLDERATNIGEFTMFDDGRGVIIERDGSQGDLEGYKAIHELRLDLDDPGSAATKRLAVDLLDIADPHGVVRPEDVLEGDVGLGGGRFALPFNTIESVVVFDEWQLLVAVDNNYPGSVGRHVGAGLSDDNEFVLIRLGQPLGEL